MKLIHTIFYSNEVKSLRNYQDYSHSKLTQEGEHVTVCLFSRRLRIPGLSAQKPTIMRTQSPI